MLQALMAASFAVAFHHEMSGAATGPLAHGLLGQSCRRISNHAGEDDRTRSIKRSLAPLLNAAPKTARSRINRDYPPIGRSDRYDLISHDDRETVRHHESGHY